ncbi:hypothetical protein BTJ68_05094 [Hortaea werneckii EXF-2000]|uniref:Heterokaryon incompatibility domain-containing protein n=1 Tax=Hortaea werneckii EXF-2000 TaxID=1157616 RepID=A0A1Z5TIY6_HORWE|nr:hypothetical protein BTJ68_05094 [Hortaea werneckii EXF-2000]
MDLQPTGVLICARCQGYKRTLAAFLISSVEDGTRADYGAVKLFETFKSLETSARNGCNLCRFWTSALIDGCFSHQDLTRFQASSAAVSLTLPVVALTRNSGPRRPDEPLFMRAKCLVTADIGLTPSLGPPQQNFYKPSVWENPKNDELVEKIRNWLRQCSSSHKICRDTYASGALPKRLIRTERGRTRLVDSAFLPADVEYVTLSYCWGQGQGIVLTTSTARSLYTEIEMYQLSRTLQDAIWVCSVLGIEYIWVDALCISQDMDSPEWRAEANRMNEVYGNAKFTLSVCSASSASEGFLRPRGISADLNSALEAKMCEKSLSLKGVTLSEIRSLSPLARRGWTFQEELLSPKILYYSDQGTFWSCRSSKHTESRVVETGADRGFPDVTFPKPLDAHAFLTARYPLFLWDSMIDSYSRRAFTKSSDYLPAVSGLASLVERRTHDEHLSGLWRSRLPGQLLWVVESLDLSDIQAAPFDHHSVAAPSWSWASIGPARAIRMPKEASASALATLLESKKYLRPPRLRLGGKLRMVNADEQFDDSGVKFPERTLTITSQTHHPIVVQLDSMADLRGKRLLCFQINYHGFLLLQRVSDDGARMICRRVGCVQHHGNAGFFDDCEESKIELV